MKPYYVRWSFCVVYALAMGAASLMPAGDVPGTSFLFPHADKVVHCTMYGSLAALLLWAIKNQTGRVYQYGVVFGTTVVYGAMLEVAQGVWTTGRTFSPGDVMANAAGAGVVVVGWWVLKVQRAE